MAKTPSNACASHSSSTSHSHRPRLFWPQLAFGSCVFVQIQQHQDLDGTAEVVRGQKLFAHCLAHEDKHCCHFRDCQGHDARRQLHHVELPPFPCPRSDCGRHTQCQVHPHVLRGRTITTWTRSFGHHVQLLHTRYFTITSDTMATNIIAWKRTWC